MRINTNVSSLNAYRNLSETNNAVASSMQKLSSGFRINRAGDDAAGLGIANKLRADNRSLMQASKNAEQANAVLSIAEGAAGTIQQMLERMKELATQSGSDSVDSDGRTRIQAEFAELQAEITRTVDTTKFQGGHLLKTVAAAAAVPGTPLVPGTPAVPASIFAAASDNMTAAGGNVGTGNVTLNGTYSGAADGTISVRASAAEVAAVPASVFAAASDNMTAAGGNTATGDITLNGTYSGVADATLTVRRDAGDTGYEYSTDGTNFVAVVGTTATVAGVTVDLSGLGGVVTGNSWSVSLTAAAAGSAAAYETSTDGTTWSAVVGTSATVQGVTIDLSGVSGAALADGWSVSTVAAVAAGPDTPAVPATPAVEASGGSRSFLIGSSAQYTDGFDAIVIEGLDLRLATLGLDADDLSTRDGSRTALANIDAAMVTVATTMGDIGASQNRIDYAMSNLKTSIQNFAAAESAIRDLDMAEEMTKFSKNNILAQAGTAMLAQANQSAQGVLQLLRG